MSSQGTLKRQIGLRTATALIVGEVIAVGIFLTPYGEVVGLARAAAARLAHYGWDGFIRGALLWRVGREISRGRRRLCLSSRSLWSANRFPLWMDGSAGHGPWSDGRARCGYGGVRRLHFQTVTYSAQSRRYRFNSLCRPD
jgi:hypothetical protein